MNGIIDSNQKIVSNGLVLNYDAAQLRSYSGSGTTWTDLSGLGNNGTLTNGPTFNSANGGSIVFDGLDDYVSTNAQNLTELTICVWIKFSSISNVPFPTIVSKEGATYLDRNFFLGLVPQFQFSRTVSGSDSPVASSIIPNLNQWYYVVVTNTSTPVMRIYINGVLNNTATYSGSLTTAGSTTFIGNYTNPIYPINGNIAIVTIYNIALSATEVSQNYNAVKSRFGL
jgi:hypothetical protein